MYLQIPFVAVFLASSAVTAHPAAHAPRIDSVGQGIGNFIRRSLNIEPREKAQIIQDYGNYGSYSDYGSYKVPPPAPAPPDTTEAPPAPPASTESIPSIPVIPPSLSGNDHPVFTGFPSSTTTLTITLEPTTVTPLWSPESFAPLSSSTITEIIQPSVIMKAAAPAAWPPQTSL